MEPQNSNPISENINNTIPEQEPNPYLPTKWSKLKKENLVLITILGSLGLIILVIIAHSFLINQDRYEKDTNGTGHDDKIIQQVDWEECGKKIDELKTYIESKNYCNHDNECQIIDMPQCNFELAGLDVDTEYVAKVFSEFYSPDGDCWTGLAPECPNPKEGKAIVCENNKCLFKDLPGNYNGNQLTKDCEEYTYQDCPEVCYRYSGPSSCGWDEDFEICTEDLMTGCFSEPYNPHKR